MGAEHSEEKLATQLRLDVWFRDGLLDILSQHPRMSWRWPSKAAEGSVAKTTAMCKSPEKGRQDIWASILKVWATDPQHWHHGGDCQTPWAPPQTY